MRLLVELGRLSHALYERTPRLVAQLDQWTAGFPTGSPGGSGVSDRTGTLAVRGPCQAQRVQADYDRELVAANKALDHALKILTTAMNVVATDPLPEACKSCARLKDHRGNPVYTEVRAAGLCRWCQDYQTGHGAWPTQLILEAHHRGDRITEARLARIQAR